MPIFDYHSWLATKLSTERYLSLSLDEVKEKVERKGLECSGLSLEDWDIK